MSMLRKVLCGAAALLLWTTSAAAGEEIKPKFELAGHEKPVIALSFSPDGKRLASVGDDEKLKIWDVEKKTELATFSGCTTNQNRALWTPDGKRIIAIGNDRNIRAWDVEAKKELYAVAYADIRGGARNIALSPDGKTLALVGRSTLQLLDAETGKQTAGYTVHEQYGVDAVAWSRDGKMIATGGTDRKINLVNSADGKVAKTIDADGKLTGVEFSADGKTLFSTSDSRLAQAFDIASGAGEKIFEKGLPALAVECSRDGKLLVISGAGRGPAVLDLPERKLRTAKLESNDPNLASAISPDGKWIAGSGNGGVISIWSTDKP